MAAEDLYNGAEIIIVVLGHYLSAFHFAQESQTTLNPEWQLVMDNFIESLQLLEKHQNGHLLLMSWYAQGSHLLKEDIHQFVNQLWDHIALDRAQIELIADHHFRRCVWEFIFGVIMCIASISSLVLVLPFIANPVILAPVFMLTCMMIPLLAHFLMIRPGVNDLHAMKTLNKTLSDAMPKSGSATPSFRDVFFKESEYESFKGDISAQYIILANASHIR